jgi:hypothetical protein
MIVQFNLRQPLTSLLVWMMVLGPVLQIAHSTAMISSISDPIGYASAYSAHCADLNKLPHCPDSTASAEQSWFCSDDVCSVSPLLAVATPGQPETLSDVWFNQPRQFPPQPSLKPDPRPPRILHLS